MLKTKRMTIPALLLTAVLAVCLSLTVFAEREPVEYYVCDGNGTNWRTETVSSYIVVDSSTIGSMADEWGSGWYVVQGEVSCGKELTMDGDVRLILTAGSAFTTEHQIVIEESLTIYGQEKGTPGKLKVDCAKIDGEDSHTAIADGGDVFEDQTFTVYGGEIEAYGSNFGAGIGGNPTEDSDLIVTIYGGKVTARSSGHGAGIGGGGRGEYTTGDGGTVIIYGGEVEASSGKDGAGIGGGNFGDGGDVTINGGKVTARSYGGGAGIGGGVTEECGKVVINGGEVFAEGRGTGEASEVPGGGAGIGTGAGGDGDEDVIIINGGKVTAYSYWSGAGIGGGCGSEGMITGINSNGDGGKITINGGEVVAASLMGDTFFDWGGEGAGIGGGAYGNGGEVTINGGKVTAYSIVFGAGIGGGRDGDSGTFKMTGGSLHAYNVRGYACAVGHGSDGENEDDYFDISSYSDKIWINNETEKPIGFGLELHGLLRGPSVDISLVSLADYPVQYQSVSENGRDRTEECSDYTYLREDIVEWKDGWYAAFGSGTFLFPITVSGDVHLILTNDCSVNVCGIQIRDGGCLTIYRESEKKGESVGQLTSDGGTPIAIIMNPSNIGIEGKTVIHGGSVSAKGVLDGPGFRGELTVYGGSLSAEATDAPGIDGDLTVYGGSVTGNGGEGYSGTAGNLTMYDGTLTSQGIGNVPGITGGNIVILGGAVTAEGINGVVSIDGGTVTATGRNGVAGLGGDVTISGGTVTATGGSGAAGLGGDVTISGGNVTTYGGFNAPGIGVGVISISGGTVNAIGGDKGAGIGSGVYVPCVEIKISGGDIIATGGNDAAGIGDGAGVSCGSVTVSYGRIAVNGGIRGDSVEVIQNGNYLYFEDRGVEYCCPGVAGKDPECVNYGYKKAILNEKNNLYYSDFAFTKLIGDADVFAEWRETVGEGKIAPLGHNWNCIDAETHRCVRCLEEGQHTDEKNHDHFCDSCGTAEYYDWDSTENTLKPFWAPILPTELNSSSTHLYVTASESDHMGWYIVRGTVAINSRILVGNQVHLLLAEGSSLTVNGGIGIEPNADLTICSQTPYLARMGKITIPAGTVTDTYAGIGSGTRDNVGNEKMNCGDITISGGILDVTGGDHAAAIGSGYNGRCGDIAINGGFVKAAPGADDAEPIGAGYYGSAETVTYADGMFSEIIDGAEYVAPGEAGKAADCRTAEGGYGSVYFNAENGLYYSAFPFVSSARIGDRTKLEQWRSAGGAGYLVPLHVDENKDNVCDLCLAALLPDGVLFEFSDTVNVALESDFAVRFRGLVGVNVSGDAYMEFTVGDVSDPIRTIRVPLSKAVLEEDGRFTFSCHINVLEISEPITAVFHDGEESVAFELQDRATPVTVENYLNKILQALDSKWDRVGKLGDAEFAEYDLCVSLLNYAHYAQLALDETHSEYTVGNKKTGADYQLTGIWCPEDGWGDMGDARDSLSAYKAKRKTASEYTAVTATTRSLVLDDSTSIVVYLTLADPAVLPEITVKSDNGNGSEVPFSAYRTEDGKYRVVIPHIYASALGAGFRVDIDGGSDEGGMTFTDLSALSYAYSICTGTGSTAYKDALTALWWYYSGAVEYQKYC